MEITMKEVREEIDLIDKEIVLLLPQRQIQCISNLSQKEQEDLSEILKLIFCEM